MQENRVDPRPVFQGLNTEGEEQKRYEENVERAADIAANDVDRETVRLFWQKQQPLPVRLRRIAEQFSMPHVNSRGGVREHQHAA